MSKKLSKEEVEKKKKRIIKIGIITIVIIVALFAIYKLSDLIVLDKNKTTNLVINNKNVTANLKNEVIIRNDEMYLSRQDLANFFDKYLYLDEENNQIITTYDTKVGVISLDDKKIEINGSKKNMYTGVLKENDTIYLPLTELKDIYGIDIKYIEDSKVLVLDSVSKEQKKAIVTTTVSVKSSTKFISKTVDRVKKGSYVVVVSEENGYARVRTESGKLGYIKSNKLANTVVVREELVKEKQIKDKVNLVWDYYSEYASAPNRSGETLDGVNVVSPAFFHVDSKGNFVENVGNQGKTYVEWAHNNGYKVWPMVQNAGDGMLTVTSNILNDYEKRQNLINNIVNACVKYNLDGINVDFENMKLADKDMFSRFIIELTPRINDMGMVVSVDVTAPDGSENWSLCFDRHVIGNVADYIIFMAYDEYGASSDKAGSTAALNWVEIGVNKFLKTEEIESNKIILAIPLYARLWTETSSGDVKQSAIPLKNIESVVPNSASKEWYDDLGQYYAEWQEGANTKKIWIEDEKSLAEKIQLIKDKELGGVASWAKGMETDNFWAFLKNELNK